MGGQGLAAPKTCAKVPKLNPFGTILGPREPGVQISGKKQRTGGVKNNAQDSETKFTRLISTENQGGILL